MPLTVSMAFLDMTTNDINRVDNTLAKLTKNKNKRVHNLNVVAEVLSFTS